jgi:hypothetical protein
MSLCDIGDESYLRGIGGRWNFQDCIVVKPVQLCVSGEFGFQVTQIMDKLDFPGDESKEFDFYLQWEWPPHIEDCLRRMLWISLVESCEPGMGGRKHTSLLRWQIAGYPESPPAVLDYLAGSDELSLLKRIAENPNTGPVTLARLAQSEFPQVRVAVAENHRLPFVVMKMLVADECPDVGYALAENPGLPASLLRQLAENSNPYVATRAARTLNRRNPAKPEQLPVRNLHSRQAK